MTIHRIFDFGAYPMPATWQDQLSGARTEGEVVDVARDFIARFTPDEIAQLPDACKPGKIVDAEDISELALTLMRHHCDDGEGATTPIHRLAAFFSNASVRVSQLLQSNERQSA
jgi:hypothetical protein